MTDHPHRDPPPLALGGAANFVDHYAIDLGGEPLYLCAGSGKDVA